MGASKVENKDAIQQQYTVEAPKCPKCGQHTMEFQGQYSGLMYWKCKLDGTFEATINPNT